VKPASVATAAGAASGDAAACEALAEIRSMEAEHKALAAKAADAKAAKDAVAAGKAARDAVNHALTLASKAKNKASKAMAEKAVADASALQAKATELAGVAGITVKVEGNSPLPTAATHGKAAPKVNPKAEPKAVPNVKAKDEPKIRVNTEPVVNKRPAGSPALVRGASKTLRVHPPVPSLDGGGNVCTQYNGGKILSSVSKDGWRVFWDAADWRHEALVRYGADQSISWTIACSKIDGRRAEGK